MTKVPPISASILTWESNDVILMLSAPWEVMGNRRKVAVSNAIDLRLSKRSMPTFKVTTMRSDLIPPIPAVRKVAAKERRTDTVPENVTNLSTLIQVACLGAMFWVKESSIGVLFPFIIALLAPLRFVLENTGVVKKEYVDILDEE